jgi:hypothetical protein
MAVFEFATLKRHSNSSITVNKHIAGKSNVVADALSLRGWNTANLDIRELNVVGKYLTAVSIGVDLALTIMVYTLVPLPPSLLKHFCLLLYLLLLIPTSRS